MEESKDFLRQLDFLGKYLKSYFIPERAKEIFKNYKNNKTHYRVKLILDDYFNGGE